MDGSVHLGTTFAGASRARHPLSLLARYLHHRSQTTRATLFVLLALVYALKCNGNRLFNHVTWMVPSNLALLLLEPRERWHPLSLLAVSLPHRSQTTGATLFVLLALVYALKCNGNRLFNHVTWMVPSNLALLLLEPRERWHPLSLLVVSSPQKSNDKSYTVRSSCASLMIGKT
jgi:putative exporter of polyketide antibiotics